LELVINLHTAKALGMLKAIALLICAAFLLRATCHATELAENTAFVPTPATPTPDFEALRIKGLAIALPGPQDTIDPDFAGMRSSLAALGIGYIGYSSNNFYDNMLPAERATFGQQLYNGQKPTFFTNNVMQMTYDLSGYGISDGQIVVGGIYNFDTWEPGGPNASSLASLSYYQTFLNRQVELKVGYQANVVEYWGPFLAGNLAASIFGPSGSIPVEAGLSAWAWTKPAINIKVNGPAGLYNKFGVQVASNPDGPLAEKTANPTGLDWSTPNSGVLAIDEFGYRKEASPGQLGACRTDRQHKQIRRFRIWRAEYRELRSVCFGGSTICPTGVGRRSGCERGLRWRQRNVRAAGVQSLQPVLRTAPLRDRPSAVPPERYGLPGGVAKCV
jgi:porin